MLFDWVVKRYVLHQLKNLLCGPYYNYEAVRSFSLKRFNKKEQKSKKQVSYRNVIKPIAHPSISVVRPEDNKWEEESSRNLGFIRLGFLRNEIEAVCKESTYLYSKKSALEDGSTLKLFIALLEKIVYEREGFPLFSMSNSNYNSMGKYLAE